MMAKRLGGNGLVYSSEHGRMCRKCDNPIDACTCARDDREARAAAPAKGPVRVARETKGRKGAGVTLVYDLPLDADGVKGLAKELKSRCGAGGTVKDGVIEIQGDHRDAIIADLEKRGWKVKRVGG